MKKEYYRKQPTISLDYRELEYTNIKHCCKVVAQKRLVAKKGKRPKFHAGNVLCSLQTLPPTPIWASKAHIDFSRKEDSTLLFSVLPPLTLSPPSMSTLGSHYLLIIDHFFTKDPTVGAKLIMKIIGEIYSTNCTVLYWMDQEPMKSKLLRLDDFKLEKRT
jgi:hypothetical protein